VQQEVTKTYHDEQSKMLTNFGAVAENLSYFGKIASLFVAYVSAALMHVVGVFRR